MCSDGLHAAAEPIASDRALPLGWLQGYSYVPPGKDAVLREALFSRGPIAISLDAGQPSFRFYGRGGESVWCAGGQAMCRQL